MDPCGRDAFVFGFSGEQVVCCMNRGFRLVFCLHERSWKVLMFVRAKEMTARGNTVFAAAYQQRGEEAGDSVSWICCGLGWCFGCVEEV